MRKIIWENRVKNYESHIRGYTNAYGRKLTNDEAILFALSQLLLHYIRGSNMLRQLTSTEYKMYKYATEYFTETKNEHDNKYFESQKGNNNEH